MQTENNIQMALNKLKSAQRCHPNATQTLIEEAIELLDSSPSPRITEQDAREIIEDYLGYCDGKQLKPVAPVVLGLWIKRECSMLLNKINAKPESGKSEIVQYPSGRGVLIIADPDVNGVVIVRDESGEYRRVAKDAIKPESVGG